MGQELDSPKQEVEPQEQGDGLQEAVTALSGLMGEADDLPPHDLDAEAAQATTEEKPQQQPQKTDDTKAPVEDKAAAIALKIGDKEYSIPAESIPEELRDVVKDGILMRADYTRKVQEVAEQRKATEARVQQMDQVMQAVSQFPDHLAAIRSVDAQLHQLSQPELWQRLQAEDPSGIRIIQAKQAYQDLMNQRGNLLGQLDRARQEVTSAQAQRVKEYVSSQIPMVKEAIPDFNEAKVKELRDGAMTHYGKLGLQPEHLNQVTDAFQLAILNDALQFRALQAQKTETTNKVEKLPPKVIRSGTSSGPQGPALNQSAMQRLKQSGGVQDAAAAIASLLE